MSPEEQIAGALGWLGDGFAGHGGHCVGPGERNVDHGERNVDHGEHYVGHGEHSVLSVDALAGCYCATTCTISRSLFGLQKGFR